MHPEVAYRDCSDCQTYVYNEDGSQTVANGKRIRRPPGTHPPCATCPKKGPDSGLGLSSQNWEAYVHYGECKAVGRFPFDAIVQYHAGIIRTVEDQVEAFRQEAMIELLKAALR